MQGPHIGTFGGATPGDAPILCLALGKEVRRVAFGETRHGDGMIWLLAQLTADRREVTLSSVVLRLGAALMASNGPAVWEHARSELDDIAQAAVPGRVANDTTPVFPPEPDR